MGKCISHQDENNNDGHKKSKNVIPIKNVIDPVQKYEDHSTEVLREIFKKNYELPYPLGWLPLKVKPDNIPELWSIFIENCKNKGYDPTKPKECIR